MKKVLLILMLLPLLSGCTYKAVTALNREVVKDLEAGIARIEEGLEAEREEEWSQMMALLESVYEQNLAQIKLDYSAQPDKLIEAYEALKATLRKKVEQAGINLAYRMKIKRENKLADFINALDTSKGADRILSSYTEPDWEAIEKLVHTGLIAIIGG